MKLSDSRRRLNAGYLLLLVASGIPAVVGFLLTPQITASVSTVEYGNFVAYQTLAAVLNLVVGVSSAGYISNAFIHPHSAPLISSSLLSTALLSLPLVGFAAWLLNRSFQSYSFAIVLAMVFSGLLTYVITYFQTYAILRKAYGYLLALAIAQFFSFAGLVYYFISQHELTFTTLILSSLSGLLISATICVVYIRRQIAWRFVRPQWSTIKKIVLYGLPLMPHLLLSLATGSFDRWLLAKTENVGLLAVYSVALSVAAPMYILLDTANKIYSPLIFDRLREDKRRVSDFWRLVVMFNTFSLIAAVCVSVFGFLFIRYSFSTEYQDAAWFCVPLCFAIGAFSIYYSAAPFLYYFNQTRLILLASLVGAVITILVTIFAFPLFDAGGLIVGKSLGFLATGIVALGWAIRVLKSSDVER